MGINNTKNLHQKLNKIIISRMLNELIGVEMLNQIIGVQRYDNMQKKNSNYDLLWI
jgi:low affinity Fe/Cu permease